MKSEEKRKDARKDELAEAGKMFWPPFCIT